MREFISKLTERGYTRRTVGIIQNGSWAPSAAKTMKSLLEGAKDITFTECEVTVTSGLNDASLSDISRLADELCK
jgi:flavorubredoxin